jgi:type IV pilus assembly protein PilV
MNAARETAAMRGGRRRAQAAFGLVETLVALVVISVGMIGMAALFGHGLVASRTSLARTQAVNLAADMAERIRGNRLGEHAYGAAPFDHGCEPAGTTSCTPQEMAEHDVFVWTARVATSLPDGTGTVSVAGGTPAVYTVRVAWRETGMDAGAADQSYTVEIAVAAL